LQRIRYVWVRAGLVTLVAMPFVAFLMFRAQGLPEETLASTSSIEVVDGDGSLLFAQRGATNAERLMILPGCPPDPVAYAPLARSLAARGLTSAVVRVPYRCAPLPQHVSALHTRVRVLLDTCADCRWTVVGHSRGAVHALDLVVAMPRRFSRLVLMGTTHPRERDFSALTVPVLKIVATRDGVAPLASSEANRRLLPSTTRWAVIEGGNHSQFAYYGFQLFDRRATISREEQHARVAELVMSFIFVNK
jgi:pimeloyl-ACP methyl ester carboxylesterase